MTVNLSNTLWKPFTLFLVMPLYFVAPLPPENIQENKPLMVLVLFIDTLFGRNSPDTVENKPFPEACNIIVINLQTLLL